MFDNYIASEKDFRAINEALSFVWHPRMKFVFREPRRIKNVLLVSYDSRYIFLWARKRLSGIKPFKKEGEYFFYKIPHKLRLKDEWQYVWKAGIWDERIEAILPSEVREKSDFAVPRISGGLLVPFTELQREIKGDKSNPYTTKEGYLATIIHEFAHVYWNAHKLWWFSDKKQNLRYLSLAKKLYMGSISTSKISLRLPSDLGIGEIFAFCTEYYASSIFWFGHKLALDNFAKKWIEFLIKQEKKKNLEKEDSTLEPSRHPHCLAFVFGKVLITLHPHDWPLTLTNHLTF